MIKISCYRTPSETLAKTFCQLAQKCYQSSFNTCVITKDTESTLELDKTLWTFSKKYFIPHATDQDPLPEKQPIFITNSVINPNKSTYLIIVNPTSESLINIISEKKIFKDLTKIFIIFEDNTINFQTISYILSKSHYETITIDFFEQNINGSWHEIKDSTNKN